MPTTTHGQAEGGTGLEVGAGPVYLRALDGDGFGAEVDFRLAVSGNMFHGKSAIGVRLWVSELGTPNAWLGDLRVTGFGVNWRTRWSLVKNRLSAHVTIPLELMIAGQYGLRELEQTCVFTNDGWICELGNPQTAPAMGVAGGVDLRLVGGLHVTAAMNTLWTTLERSDGKPVILGFLGLAFSFGRIN